MGYQHIEQQIIPEKHYVTIPTGMDAKTVKELFSNVPDSATLDQVINNGDRSYTLIFE